MGWHIIRPGHIGADQPQIAGYHCLITVENKMGQVFVTTGFTGYGDYKWYACEKTYYTDPKGGNNELHPAWKVLAWQEIPEPYNPYKIDVRHFIKELSNRIKTPKSTIEIVRAIRDLEEGFCVDYDCHSIREHDAHAKYFWDDEAFEKMLSGEEHENGGTQ